MPPDLPPPPAPEPRRNRELELATLKNLRALLPPDQRRSGIAVSALILARRIDAAPSSDRDATALHHQYRMHMERLADSAPGERTGDATDEARARIEANRQLHVVGELGYTRQITGRSQAGPAVTVVMTRWLPRRSDSPTVTSCSGRPCAGGARWPPGPGWRSR